MKIGRERDLGVRIFRLYRIEDGLFRPGGADRQLDQIPQHRTEGFPGLYQQNRKATGDLSSKQITARRNERKLEKLFSRSFGRKRRRAENLFPIRFFFDSTRVFHEYF